MPSASIIGIIGLLATIGSTAASVTADVKASKTQEDIAKYQARLLREKGAEDESRARRQAQIELGRERAVLGKLGILPTSGSPLEQLARNAGEAERGAVLASRGLLDQSSLYQAQASSISSQRGMIAASGVLSGVSSLSSTYGSPLLSSRSTAWPVY